MARAAQKVTKQKIDIEGLKELDEALKELPKATARNVVLRTLKAEAQPIADLAAQLAPDNPRTKGKDLHKAILVKPVKARSRESDVEVAVGPDKKIFYAWWVEFGTAKNNPQPYMRPAWDSKALPALYGIRKRLAEEIEKARKRLARKAERLAAKMKAAGG